MGIEVFNRHENKYLIDKTTFHKLTKVIDNYMVLDQFNEDGKTYSIYTTYFDTYDNDMIRKSLSSPKYKEKIRIRSYEEFKYDNLVYLEIKKKYNGFGNKRRTLMKYQDALKFVETGVAPDIAEYMNKQVINELSFLINKERLYAKSTIVYKRIAYKGINNDDIRITFDQDILACSNGSMPERLLDEDLILMEIKVKDHLPIWLTRQLSKYKIYKTSFSKYGQEYKKQLENQVISYLGNEIIINNEVKENARMATECKYY